MKAIGCLVTAGAAFAAGSIAKGQVHAEIASSITPESEVVEHVVRDLDGDGKAEIVIVSRDGRVRVWQLQAETNSLIPLGDAPLTLADPEYSLLAISDVLGDARLELAVLGRRGAVAWTFDPGFGFAGGPLALARTGSLAVRLGKPTLANFVRDVNADGLGDLIVPIGAACELWLRTPTESGEPHYERAQVIPLDLQRKWKTRADRASSRLESSVEIPSLDIADVNGDDRPDLRVRDGQRRSFFLQRENGRFATEPIIVDLSMFRDTTPKADIELGETAVLGDDASMQSGDLDADGIDDYVIAHRRKLWTFLSTSEGPQFRESRTRLVAEDITGLTLVHLDEDDREDLVVFKVELPNAAELVLGFVSSIDIEITALGYRTGPRGVFEDRAHWRRTLTLRIPSIIRLMSEAEDIVDRFLDVISKLRWSARGDFDGDGERDLALITEDETAVELWRKPQSTDDSDRAGARWLRKLLFEDPESVFDVERILKLASEVFDVRTASLTGDREADASSTLPQSVGRSIVDLVGADLDGDGRSELLLVTEEQATAGSKRFAVYRWVDG